MSKVIKEYDSNHNIIFIKDSDGVKWWNKYNKNNQIVYGKSDRKFEFWYYYDEENREIHFKNTIGAEYFYKYDKNGDQIKITEQEFKQIERTKERQELYLNIKNSNRFELIDI